jgi:hypothetical protein
MLRLIRKIYSDKSTIGELYLKDEFVAYTLEDTIRKLKIKHKTAIPAGQYEVVMSFSNRFQKKLPEILKVPFFTGIRIHSGNKPEDSSGCILVGKEHQQDFVTHSRETMEILIDKIEEQLKIGKLYICISGGYGADEWGNIFAVKQGEISA